MIVHTCQIPPALVTSYLDQSLNDKKHAILELQINILQGNLGVYIDPSFTGLKSGTLGECFGIFALHIFSVLSWAPRNLSTVQILTSEDVVHNWSSTLLLTVFLYLGLGQSSAYGRLINIISIYLMKQYILTSLINTSCQNLQHQS